ncbi:recombinase family protein [Bradyrhizobium sp. UFLA05-112]
MAATRNALRPAGLGGLGNLSTPKSVKLQTALHAKAKAEAGYRFYALYDKKRRMISRRIKEALAAAKARGKKLAGKCNNALSGECRQASATQRRAVADARAADIIPAITALQRAGAASLHQIAGGLTAQGIPTPRGADTWRPAQVARVLRRAAAQGSR